MSYGQQLQMEQREKQRLLMYDRLVNDANRMSEKLPRIDVDLTVARSTMTILDNLGALAAELPRDLSATTVGPLGRSSVADTRAVILATVDGAKSALLVRINRLVSDRAGAVTALAHLRQVLASEYADLG